MSLNIKNIPLFHSSNYVYPLWIFLDLIFWFHVVFLHVVPFLMVSSTSAQCTLELRLKVL